MYKWETDYTTIPCPSSTAVTWGNKTYTVTSATTLTLPVTSIKTIPAGPVYTTTAVTSVWTTYCPSATTVTYGNKTIPVTSATTLTIPVTSVITTPVTISTASSYTWSVVTANTTVQPPASSPTTVTIQTKTIPVSKSTVIPYTSTITYPVGPVPTGGKNNTTSATSSIVSYTGAASKPMATGFAALLAVAALL